MTMPRFVRTHFDLLLATALGAVYLAEVLGESGFGSHRPVAVVAALAFSATLTLRRRAPLVPLAAAVVLIEFANLVVNALAETGAFLFSVIVVLYACGRYARGRAALVSLALIAAAIPLAAIEPGQKFSFSDLAFFLVFFPGPWIAARVMRYRQEREHALAGRAAELEVERDTKARVAVAEERVRIARELHDVVAHAISVIVLQARGGRRMLGRAPTETHAALDAIEHAGEQALVEMRRLLGMLREGDEELALAPQPSLSRIDELVASLKAIGLPVDVRIEGTPVELPPGIDVSAYRIVQEALTNALKHAGPARARVILRYLEDDLELEILDDGAGNGNGGGSGHGLAGMRERVAVYGGELQSGLRPEGGYALRARLPLGSSR